MNAVVAPQAQSPIRSRMRWLQRTLRPIQRDRQLGCCMTAGMGRETVEVHLTETAGGRPRAYYRGLHRCGSPWACPTCRQRAMLVRCKDLETAIQHHGVESCLFLTGTVRHSRHDDLALNQQVIKLAYSKFQQGEPWKRGRLRLGWEHSVITWEHTWSAHNGWHPHFHGLAFCDSLGVPELDRPDSSLYGWKARRQQGEGDWVVYGVGSARCSAIARALKEGTALDDADGVQRLVSEWAVPASWLDWARSRWVQSVRRAVEHLAKGIADDERAAWTTEKLERYQPSHEVGLVFERCLSSKVKAYLTKMGLEPDDDGSDDAVQEQFVADKKRRFGLDGAGLADAGRTELPREVRLAREVVNQGQKHAREGSLDAFQIAWQFALACRDLADGTGDKHYVSERRAVFRSLWQEYCRVTEGLRHMTWSKGARVALGVAKPDEDDDGLSDDAIAANEDLKAGDEEGSDRQVEEQKPVALIPRCLYADLVRSGADDAVLRRAEPSPDRPPLRGPDLVAYALSLLRAKDPDTPALYPVPDELGQGPVCLRRSATPPGPRPSLVPAQRSLRFA
ncbi:MAG: hypothetical protein FJ095_21325 [Deltaproteobacteria bacterium]|nr:hypothetical protein [Deltaproteobacteria bacterium]